MPKSRAQTAKTQTQNTKPQTQSGTPGSCAGSGRAPAANPAGSLQDSRRSLRDGALTLLTLREAKGGGVSVRSLIISTSDTYCKFTSRMSAWLGLPLEEGHSGGGGLRKTNPEGGIYRWDTVREQTGRRFGFVGSSSAALPLFGIIGDPNRATHLSLGLFDADAVFLTPD